MNIQVQVTTRQDGSIGIPVNVRNRLGIQPGTQIQITSDRQGRIYLKPLRSKCACCGLDQMAVSSVDGMCPACNNLVEFYIREGFPITTAIRKARVSGRDSTH